MTIRRIARGAGWVISLLCLAYFIRHVQNVGLAGLDRSPAVNATFVLSAAAAYAAAVCLLAAAWVAMLATATPTGCRRVVFSSYLIGQFAKYLPGNIFQYAARHGLGRKAGVPHGALVAAAFAEVFLLVCAGAAVAVAAGGPIITLLVPEFPRLPVTAGLLPLILAFGILIPAWLLPSATWVPRFTAMATAITLATYVGFFLMFGSLYWATLVWSIDDGAPWLHSAGTAAAAWLAGFVIPGAPAGAGLREAALSFGVAPDLAPAGIATSILLFRLVTLLGDFMAFAAGWLMNHFTIQPTRTVAHRGSST